MYRMSIRSRAPDVRMSSPLITVTTAGLSFSLVIANDATCVAALLSSPVACTSASDSGAGTGAAGCSADGGGAGSDGGSAGASTPDESSMGRTGPSCARAPEEKSKIEIAAASAVRGRWIVITQVL